MAAIKSKDSSPELFFRKGLWHLGFRYVLHKSEIPGHPDIYLPCYRAAVFIHGCFWHRHQNCSYTTTPARSVESRKNKFQRNVQRDKLVAEELRQINIRRLVVWECTIRKMRKDIEFSTEIFSKTAGFFKSDKMELEL